jgi:hypothetical protein
MEDAAFKKAVIDALGGLCSDLDRVAQRMSDEFRTLRADVDAGFERSGRRMDAVNVRLDEHDTILDDLRTDQMSLRRAVLESIETTTRAINRTHDLSKRVGRLENPDD